MSKAISWAIKLEPSPEDFILITKFNVEMLSLRTRSLKRCELHDDDTGLANCERPPHGDALLQPDPRPLLQHALAVANKEHTGRSDAKKIGEKSGNEEYIVDVPVEDVANVRLNTGEGHVQKELTVDEDPP